ncbi:MAG: TIGR04211 family SH3 domain-containing protein [Gammaproteobacteria bacterium]|nr:TIGR04211 family SH3 domain-containing protein [Gammaproteobacteria bacterium]NND39418.1 TIGR04211 family SH3 domain-containing protein [Pseudomonadales bacterium]MBT8151779.1 TIGR04211 family SH3 domain-containing protein [Gammaproteobacteria bacterium]NNL10514.1 TIGR04211 family SH3 domain-containing protein [Pseudomonadales bacterium]NNM10756.1 TIGR04211 family SH3 domain-containing protein [Pseudomonadales bacterium]
MSFHTLNIFPGAAIRLARLFAVLALAGGLACMAKAQGTGYVADVFYVPLHSGKSTKHRIVHRGIKTGTQLTVLEADADAGFTKVRTKGGTEGWIQNQYLSTTPIARIQLAAERAKRRELQQRLNAISSENKSVSEANNDARKQLQSLSKQNQSLSSELASIKKISSNAVNLDISNRELLQKNEMLKVSIAELQAENSRLSDKSNKDWFMRGALAVAIGALLAVILPRFKPKSRNSEWA